MFFILALSLFLSDCALVDAAGTYSFNVANSNTRCGDRSYKFWSNMHVPLSQCISECGRRPKCLALNHRSRYSNYCELLETTEVVTPGDGGCTYLRREDIDLSALLPAGCTCAVDETCDTNSNTCSITECSAIRTMPNGQIFGNRFSIGHSVVAKCNQGYEALNGVTKVTCTDTGLWTDMPVCIRMCDAPEALNNGAISGTGQYFSQNTTLSVTCNSDYREANGRTSITCLTTALWDCTPECVLKECPPPSLQNGVITGSVYTIGSTLTVSCNEGYGEPEGIVSIACLSTQLWNSSPTCTLRECDNPPSLPNGQISTAAIYTVGTSLTVNCDTYYHEETAASSITCLTTAVWDYTPNCVIMDCPDPPSLAYGVIETAVAYPVGTTLAIICNTNYGEEFSRTFIECSSKASWNFTPKCKRIECNEPNIEYGNIHGHTFKAGDDYSVHCDSGYEETLGRSSVSCLSSGSWDYTPQCVRSYGTCDTGWVQFETSCFYISVDGEGAYNFDQAQTFCQSLSGNLARLDSFGKYDVVRQELNRISSTSNNYWIGLRRYSESGPLTWLDNGVEYVYNNFASGEPGTNTEYCVFLWKSDGWYWHAGQCSWTDRLVCEKLSN